MSESTVYEVSVVPAVLISGQALKFAHVNNGGKYNNGKWIALTGHDQKFFVHDEKWAADLAVIISSKKKDDPVMLEQVGRYIHSIGKVGLMEVNGGYHLIRVDPQLSDEELINVVGKPGQTGTPRHVTIYTEPSVFI